MYVLVAYFAISECLGLCAVTAALPDYLESAPIPYVGTPYYRVPMVGTMVPWYLVARF